jgi:Histidine kinase
VSAYELVDQLPSGPARAAAWAAYAQTTYADKLLAADGRSDVVAEAYARATACLDVAQNGGGALPAALPHWRTPVRSREQLRGMRDALDALRTYLAYELHDEHAPQLARIDAQLARADELWIDRPPDEIRGAIGSALAIGLDEAYALGRQLTTA